MKKKDDDSKKRSASLKNLLTLKVSRTQMDSILIRNRIFYERF